MKPDIQHREDIVQLVNQFYEQVKRDDIIGFFFSEVVPVNWEHHLPVMYDFWENVLFHTGSYAGNPMMVHQGIHQKSAIRMEHFQQWVKLFTQTVDMLYSGDNAEKIKQRATSIATVMQMKILY